MEVEVEVGVESGDAVTEVVEVDSEEFVGVEVVVGFEGGGFADLGRGFETGGRFGFRFPFPLGTTPRRRAAKCGGSLEEREAALWNFGLAGSWSSIFCSSSASFSFCNCSSCCPSFISPIFFSFSSIPFEVFKFPDLASILIPPGPLKILP